MMEQRLRSLQPGVELTIARNSATIASASWKRSLVRALMQKAYSNLMGECSLPLNENSAVVGDTTAED